MGVFHSMLLTAFISISIQEEVYVIQAVFNVEDFTDLIACFSSTFFGSSVCEVTGVRVYCANTSYRSLCEDRSLGWGRGGVLSRRFTSPLWEHIDINADLYMTIIPEFEIKSSTQNVRKIKTVEDVVLLEFCLCLLLDGVTPKVSKPPSTRYFTYINCKYICYVCL